MRLQKPCDCRKSASNCCHFPQPSWWGAVSGANCILLLEPGLLCPPGHPPPPSQRGSHLRSAARGVQGAPEESPSCSVGVFCLVACFLFSFSLLQAWVLKSRQKCPQVGVQGSSSPLSTPQRGATLVRSNVCPFSEGSKGILAAAFWQVFKVEFWRFCWKTSGCSA